MTPRFIGRERQLAALARFYAAPDQHLATVRGRRRVGKSTLLLRSLEPGRSAYHQAAQLTADANLARFVADMLAALRDHLDAAHVADLEHARDWRSALLALGRAAADLGRLTVVLDEFPYLTRSDPGLESVVQEALGRIASLGQPLKLVLCGSAISAMEALVAHSSPLHGRSDLNMVLAPLDYLESAAFTPAWSDEDLVRARSLFGGMPRYLALLDDTRSVGENFESLVMDPDGPLHEEPARLLQAELSEPRVYASLLQAMSQGHTRAGEIIGASGVPASSLNKYLERLEELGLVRRVRSVGAPPAARNLRYAIADPFLATWYRAVLPNLSALRVRGAQGMWARAVAPTIDEHPGAAPGAFEDLCRHWTAVHLPEWWDGEHSEVGSLLQGRGDPDGEIDVACALGRGQARSWLLGECKWRAQPRDARMLRRLQDHARALLPGADVAQWLLFSRSGFTPEVAAAGVRAVTLAELYGH